MGKRHQVDVDEDLIRRMMKGGVPRIENRAAAEESPEPAEEALTEDIVTGQAEATEMQKQEFVEKPAREAPKISKRRGEQKDYSSVFLLKKPGEQRRQTYISAHVYDKIMHYLPVIAGQFSITNYLDNIICHHLDQYGEEINALYDRNFRKPF